LIFRRTRVPRIRVAAIIVRDGKLLLIAHRKSGKVYWLLPGGGVDLGESLTGALVRELREELGIEAAVGDIALVCDSIDPSGGRHIVNIFFRCSGANGDFRLGSDKRLHDYGFYSADEIRSMVIFPPIKDEILDLLDERSRPCLYTGERWVEF
jgi:8-oxo-dGTP diphosphatase